MKCEHAEMLMGELLAGEIQSGERAELDRHLMECASCRLDFEAARVGFRVDWPDTPPSLRVVDATLAAFREPPALLRFFQVGTAAAAALLVALLLVGSGGRSKESKEALKPSAAPPRYLAAMPEAVVGTLDAKDEDGRPAGELGLQSHVVSVEILDGIAKTTVEENFRNHTDRRLEGTFRFPLPSDASISRLALEVNGKIEEGTCLERERAREVFEGIVRRMKDPALLEWMPGGIFQCRIFPIEPRATKRVIVAYTQALPYFKGRATYHYPLASEKTKEHPPEELRIEVTARFASELKRIESPSHHLDVQRARPNEARMSFFARNLRPENDFLLTLETADDELRVVPHKVDGDDGYFALFLTPRGASERKPGSYVFVLDRSASVTGPELEVARRVVRAMMERRIEGDRFEILAHHIDVDSSGPVDLRAANDFMDRLTPIGGCDLQKALLAAPAESEVIYIGGGTPTYGETETAKILESVKGRRIRTIGVGSRVNAPLLERLGGHFRISPNDEVGKRVIEIAATLGSAPLSEIKVEGGDAVFDVVGVRDLFHGERLVVTGRYRGPAAKLVVTARDYRRELAVDFPAKEEGNNYVRRLWAQRKISDLLALGESKKAEITELGVKHQIMTPYTSFLVLENEQMWKDHQLKREVQKQDKVLASTDGPKRDRAQELLQEGTDLYKAGKYTEASGKFEEAFQLKPSSDQVYAFMKRAGEDVIAGMMNSPERRMQDTGRRVMELMKPGESLRVDNPTGQTGPGKVPSPVTRPAQPVTPMPPPPPAVPEPRPVPKPADPTPAQKPEDPRTRAIREAYEEQVKGERPEMTIKPRETVPLTDRERELMLLVEEHRAKLSKSLNEKSLAVAEMQYTRELATRLGKDLEELEKKHVELAREHKFRSLGDRGGEVDGTPLLGDIPALGYLFKMDEFEGRRGRSTGGPDFDLQAATAAVALDPVVKTPPPGIYTLTTNVTAPGAPITDALPARLDAWIVTDQGIIDPRTNNLVAGTGIRRPKGIASLDDEEALAGPLANPRYRKMLEEKFNHLNELGVITDVAPKKPLEGKVTAVSNEIGLVVISIGKDAGVLEGDEFTVYRGGDFVAKIQIDRADRQWSAGKVVLKKTDPRVADDVSNHIFVSAPYSGKRLEEKVNSLPPAAGTTGVAPRKPIESKVTAVANEIGLVVISVGKDDGVQEGDEFVIARGGEVASKVVIDRADRKWSAGRVIQKKTDPRVGDDASYRPSKEATARVAEERADASSRRNLQVIREKFGY